MMQVHRKGPLGKPLWLTLPRHLLIIIPILAFEIFHCESKPMALPATRALNSHILPGGQDEIAIRHGSET